MRALEAGADPALGDRDGRTALEIARREGMSEIADLLLDFGVRDLISEDADAEAPSEDGETPLVAAIVGGQTELIESLLAAGADPNNARYGHSPLEAALVHRAPVGVVEALLRAGPDDEMEGSWTPLMAAANQGNRKLAELLLRLGADPSRRHRPRDPGSTASPPASSGRSGRIPQYSAVFREKSAIPWLTTRRDPS